MTRRSLVMARFVANVLVASAQPDRDLRLRPTVSVVFSPAKRSHDRAQGTVARGEEGRHFVQCDLDAISVFPSLERDIPRELGSILKKKSRRSPSSSADKVATWVEAHPHWSDPADAARDFDADMAIFLEVEQFQIQSSGRPEHGPRRFPGAHPGLRDGISQEQQGQADQGSAQGSAQRLRRICGDRLSPNRGPLPIDSGTSKSAFKNTFLKVVAKDISWHFVEHAPDDSIQDSRIER